MGVEELLQRTVGQWHICPLWVLRGKMFSLAEKSLLIALFDLWHTTGRPAWFYASNADLRRLSGLPNQSLINARRRLLDKCMLQTKPGKHRLLATSYHLSQDFLHSLTNSSPLKTSTYSGVPDLDGSMLESDPSRFRRITP